jgi:hypothetical protein
MSQSDSSLAFISGLWLFAFPDRPACAGAKEVSRFSCMLFRSVPGVFDYAGPGPGSRSIAMDRCGLPADRTESASGSMFSQLYTQPTVASIYASRAASRRMAQDSRPGWSRFSFPVGLSHPLQHAGLSRRSLSPFLPALKTFATGGYVRGHVANVISFLAHLSGSANVVTGFEFPRAEKLPANARSLTARKLRCLSPFLPALETSATGRYVRGHVANVRSFLAHLSGSANVVTGFEFPRAEKLPANARSLTARKLRCLSPFLPALKTFATGRYVRGHVANVRSFLAHLSGSANVVTGFEFPRAEKLPANARSLTARKLRCLSPFLPALETFATGRYVRGHVANVISFLAHLSGSANVVTGFEFPRAEKLPANARSLTARKLRCLSPFLPALETSATGRYVRGHVANVRSFLAHLSGSANVVTGFEFLRAEKLPANARSLTARKLRCLSPFLPALETSATGCWSYVRAARCEYNATPATTTFATTTGNAWIINP